ncbi:EamA domain-containing membrane protein RarD [Pseudogulbenkiania subflava DSM 22618]|uniref:EamA domain-containing membrane protein RarD n=2 Tax=Pseudogulbenkiania subflava TaxID=451637 RepID=A0A1Y6BC13_9NEIS|nr:EamA domain-containing membrane protein RarD [Pseudogulbenkiania subflava DSM 22618]
MPPSLIGLIQVLLSAVAFGTMAILARFAYADGTTTTTLLLLRFVIAGLVLLPWVALQRLPWPTGRALLALIVMGAVGYAGMSACYFNALNHASAGTVALLLYLYPVLVLLLSMLLGERLTSLRLIALLLALSGLAVTIGLEFSARPLGLLLGVGAALIYSCYILIGSRFTAGTHPLAATCVVILSAAASYVLQSTWQGWGPPHSARGWLAIVMMALICTVAAVALFLNGLEKIGATRASLVSTVEPVVTLLLAWGLLGEPIGLSQALGGLLILGAVLLVSREADPKRTELTELHD